MFLNNSRGPGLSINNLAVNRATSRTSRPRPSEPNKTIYSDSLSINSNIVNNKLNKTIYSESLYNISNIKKSIGILSDYIRLKHTLNKTQRTKYLKDAIEEIEKEIEKEASYNGGVRYKRGRTYKKSVYLNRTRSRK